MDEQTENPQEASPETPPVIDPNVASSASMPDSQTVPTAATTTTVIASDSPEATGTDITSGTVPSPEAPVTVQTTAPAIPQPIKETFLQKLEDDAEAAWAWLEKEMAKL